MLFNARSTICDTGKVIDNMMFYTETTICNLE